MEPTCHTLGATGPGYAAVVLLFGLAGLLAPPGAEADLAGADSDGDGVADVKVNCTLAVNPDQRDSNRDGFGNVCDADPNNDGIVNFGDLALLTHGIWPIVDPGSNDNQAAIQLQGYAGTISECTVCHVPGNAGFPLGLNGPHGMHPIADYNGPDPRWNDEHKEFFEGNEQACRTASP